MIFPIARDNQPFHDTLRDGSASGHYNWRRFFEMARCRGICDNSAADFANPNATKRVQWGELTWEEMMTGTIDYVVLK